ncbi:MAG: CBS domain-containing protein [Rhodospirillaceae bacterium]
MPHRKTLSDLICAAKLVSLPAQATAALAARKMLECQVGAVVVQDGDRLLGIVTERDINFRVVAIGRDPLNTSLADIMTRNPKTMVPETPVLEALNLMQKNSYRHVPVVEDGLVIAIVSLRDIFMEVRRSLEQDIQESDDFIVRAGGGAANDTSH